MNKTINIILCIDKEGGISKDGVIPWIIKEDRNYYIDNMNFRINNKPNLLVMGRNTFEKAGLSNKNETHIITQLNSDKFTEKYNITNNNYSLSTSIENTISYINTNYNLYSKIYICGGKQTYDDIITKYVNNAHIIKLYLTKINKDYNCDNKVSNKYIEISNELDEMKKYIEYSCIDEANGDRVLVKFYKPVKLYMLNRIEYMFDENNLEERQYLNLLLKLLNSSNKIGRNGPTYYSFGEKMEFNIEHKFPLLTSKKVFFDGIIKELIFFIKGQTDSKILEQQNVNIWKSNTNSDFLSKMKLNYREGDMGPMYGFQWRHYGAKYNGCDSYYTDCGFDQLSQVINLLKTDPSSRRILLTTYNPEQASQGVLYPCHGISIIFNTELDIDNIYKLNIMQVQRSCDMFLGVPFNIASYSLLIYILVNYINNDIECKFKYKPGKLVFILGDYHLYDVHIEHVKRQLLRESCEFPILQIKQKITNLDNITPEYFELINYNSFGPIQAPMVA